MSASPPLPRISRAAAVAVAAGLAVLQSGQTILRAQPPLPPTAPADRAAEASAQSPPVSPGGRTASAPATVPEPEPDIRPPRPMVEIPAPPASRTARFLTAAAAVMGGLLGWLAWRKWRRAPASGRASPLEEARGSLRQIHAERDSLTSALLAERTACAVRDFLARRFGMAAPQRATGELLRQLELDLGSPLRAHAEELKLLLLACDRAKFAEASFDPVERFALLEDAGRFIQAADLVAAMSSRPETGAGSSVRPPLSDADIADTVGELPPDIPPLPAVADAGTRDKPLQDPSIPEPPETAPVVPPASGAAGESCASRPPAL